MSWFSGTPVEIYAFNRGSQAWYFTTSKVKYIQPLGPTYVPDYIKRGSIRSTGDKGRQTIDVTVKASHALVQPYGDGSTQFPTYLTVMRCDTDDDVYRTIWMGRVIQTEFGGEEAKLRCEPVSTTLKRVGLRRPFQVLCPYALYDPLTCKAVEVNIAATVTVITGRFLTVSLPWQGQSSYLAGGKFYGVGGAIYDILEHQNFAGPEIGGVHPATGFHQILLSTFPRNLVLNSVYNVVRGCAHNISACKEFANLDNYGGFPYMPYRNPFGPDPIL